MPRGTIRAWSAWSVAVVLCGFVTLVGLAVCAVGLGRRYEDFCGTSPAVDAQVGDSVRGPSIEWPNHLRCSFDFGNRPDVVITSWEPLEWTVFCTAAVLAGMVVVVMVARRLSSR